MNKSVLYENIISAISYSIKHSINEMARKSVNRTIDKKLWLTVSSIISRNRATEAENIKPIGSDKDNLLQRYVAALLIMKKPCPKSEEDIEDIKTFKLIGQKYLELGGTIADIKRLYNENSGDSSVANVKNDIPVQTPESEDNTEDDDSDWNSLFDTDSDDDDLFSDVDSADTKNREFDNSVLAQAAEVDKDTPLQKIFTEITGTGILPRGMKLIIPKKSNELQRIETNITQFSYLSKYNQIGKFILSFLNKWNKIYTNPLYLNLGEENTGKCNILHDSAHIYYSTGKLYNPDVFVPTVIINSNDTVDSIHKKQKENGSDHLFTDKAIQAYLNDYYKTLNNISEPCVKKLMENNALIDTVYFSPDNGLMLYYCIEEIQLPNYKSYGSSELSLTTNNRNDIIIQYKGKIIITFTGKQNYAENIGYNNDNTIQSAKNLRKKYKVFNKIFIKYAYNFKQLWGFDEQHFKVINEKPCCVYDFSNVDWLKNPANAIIYSGFYKSNIKRANIDKPVKGSSIMHPAWYQALPSNNHNVYIMKDTKDMCLFTQNFNDYSMIFELTDKGLELYNNILDGKIDIKRLD